MSFLFFRIAYRVLRIVLIIKSITGALSVQVSRPSCKIYIFLVGVRFIRPETGFMNQPPILPIYLLLILNAIFRDMIHEIRDTNLVLIDRRDACPTDADDNRRALPS